MQSSNHHKVYRIKWCLLRLVLLVLLAGLGGCYHLLEPQPDQPPLVYQPQGPAPAEVLAWAPAFLVYNPQQLHNRLGTPRAEGHGDGQRVWVDPQQPAIYYRQMTFSTARGAYTNLVYRVHFPGTPASLLPFFIGAGNNLGLLVIVTLDQGGRPVLVSTLGTCGCYLAMVPTSYLDPAALPPDWSGQTLEIYGERLPARLDFGGLPRPRLLVSLRPGEHRVMDLAVLEGAPANAVATPLRPAEDLERLPLPEGEVTSFYYPDGPLAGHVKGAWKPWETLFLGLPSLDALVGMDKDFPHPRNPFYTSLKPWARQDSDLRDFPRLLAYYGWRL